MTTKNDGKQNRTKKIVRAVLAITLLGGVAAWWFHFRQPAAPKEIIEVMRLPEVTSFLDKQVLVAAPQGPEEFLQFMKHELVKWDKVIRAAGIKVE